MDAVASGTAIGEISTGSFCRSVETRGGGGGAQAAAATAPAHQQLRFYPEPYVLVITDCNFNGACAYDEQELRVVQREQRHRV